MCTARSPINLTGDQVTPIKQAPMEEVLAVPERDTSSQVMTASARPEAVTASLTTAERRKFGAEHVETLEKETPFLSQGYVTTPSDVTSVVHGQQIQWRIAIQSSTKLKNRSVQTTTPPSMWKTPEMTMKGAMTSDTSPCISVS